MGTKALMEQRCFNQHGVGIYTVLLLLLLLSCFSHVRLCATPLDSSPPGSPVPGILQARTLEWVALQGRYSQQR